MISAIVSLLAALFRAVPSLASIASEAYALAEKANAAEAAKRKQDKDAAVDAAIDKRDTAAEFVEKIGGEK